MEQNFELPLTFRVGVAMDMMDFADPANDQHALLMSVAAQRPRDYHEQLIAGVKYSFLHMLALRAGYTLPADEEGVRLGGGSKPSYGDFISQLIMHMRPLAYLARLSK